MPLPLQQGAFGVVLRSVQARVLVVRGVWVGLRVWNWKDDLGEAPFGSIGVFRLGFDSWIPQRWTPSSCRAQSDQYWEVCCPRSCGLNPEATLCFISLSHKCHIDQMQIEVYKCQPQDHSEAGNVRQIVKLMRHGLILLPLQTQLG